MRQFQITPKGIWVHLRSNALIEELKLSKGSAVQQAIAESELAPEVRPIVVDEQGKVVVF